VSNLSKLRRSVRASQLGAEDDAGVQWAAQLATVLDRATPRTLTQIAAGERDMTLEDALEVLRIVGPQYLRTLTALGLTRRGRAVGPTSSIPTAGSAQGAAADESAHERHRQLFSERNTG
jgi:hypothetical protein